MRRAFDARARALFFSTTEREEKTICSRCDHASCGARTADRRSLLSPLLPLRELGATRLIVGPRSSHIRHDLSRGRTWVISLAPLRSPLPVPTSFDRGGGGRKQGGLVHNKKDEQGGGNKEG